MEKAAFGMIGLGVMGQNLALNIADHGYTVAVYNRSESRTVEFMRDLAEGKKIVDTYSYPQLAESLEKPRRIMLMVKAGPAVDAVIADLKPYLEAGDILIDGGNSFFVDTKRRNDALSKDGILYIGAGISGGEEGARHGPSIMPGGDREAWEAVREVLTAAAARADDGQPCVDYIGPGGAGHYVKMVHNGIEYGDMQMIAEIYDLLHRGLGIPDRELGELFADWDQNELSSYLVEITAEILKAVDPETGQPILDVILDEARQKGTGKWTSQNAMDLGAPTHTINAAVASRIISGMKEERMEAARLLKGPEVKFSADDRGQLMDAAGHALYAGRIISYAQGFGLMRLASMEYDFNLDLEMIARIWRGGCIIRTSLLDDIMKAFTKAPGLTNLLLDEDLREEVIRRQGALRYVIAAAVGMGIPVYALSAALGYFDAFRTARLPANLTQAQRDYFGAHTYRCVDREGSFHTEWTS